MNQMSQLLYNIPYGTTIIYTMLLCLLYPSIISYNITYIYSSIILYNIPYGTTIILYIQPSIIQHYIIISMISAYGLLYIPIIIQLLYNIPYGTIYTMLLRLQYSSIILYNIP